MGMWQNLESQSYNPATGMVDILDHGNGQTVTVPVDHLSGDQLQAFGIADMHTAAMQDVNMDAPSVPSGDRSGNYLPPPPSGPMQDVNMSPPDPNNIVPQAPQPVWSPGPVSMASTPEAPQLGHHALPEMPTAPTEFPKKKGASPGTTAEPGSDIMSTYNKGMNSQIAGLKGSAKNEADTQGEIQKELDNRISEDKRAQEEANRTRMAQNEYISNQQKKVDDMNAEAAQPIDPKRLWNSKSNGEKATAAIAIFAGAMGDAFQRIGGGGGGGNPALDIIMKSIDDDIDAQKENNASKRWKAGQEMNLLRVNQERFQNDNQAELATRAQMNDHMAWKMQSLAAGLANKDAQNKLLMGAGELQKNSAKFQADLQNSIADNAMKMGAYNAKFAPSPGQKGLFQEEQKLSELRKLGVTKPDLLLTSGNEQTYEGAANRWAIQYLQASKMRVTKENAKMIRESFFPSWKTFSKAGDSFVEARKNAIRNLAGYASVDQPPVDYGE